MVDVTLTTQPSQEVSRKYGMIRIESRSVYFYEFIHEEPTDGKVLEEVRTDLDFRARDECRGCTLLSGT